MLRFIGRRLLFMLPMLFLTSVVAFFLYSHQPGDQVYNYLPLDAMPADVERVRHNLGLDQPWYVQYGKWLEAALHGNLGRSMNDRQPVAEKFAAAIPITASIFGLGTLIAFGLGLLVGVMAAVKQYSLFDHATTVLVYLGQSVPNFWFGLMLILLFTARLHLLPVAGLHTPRLPPSLPDTLKHLVMPLAVIVWEGIAVWARYVRSSMLEVLRLDYVRTARAKGLKERLVIYKHALRNSLLPVVTILGFTLSNVVGGSLVIETLFSIPGMGRITVSAVFAKDYPVLMGATLLFPGLTMLGIVISDVLYSVVDPRIRYA